MDHGAQAMTETVEDKKLVDEPDSKTSDVSEEIRVSEHDDRMTMRINSGLKRAILRHCRAKGLSVCHINDGLWIGYLRGWNEKIELDVKSPTLNVTVVRDVKRVRRYAVEEEAKPLTKKELEVRVQEIRLERDFGNALSQWPVMNERAQEFYLKKARENPNIPNAKRVLAIAADEGS